MPNVLPLRSHEPFSMGTLRFPACHLMHRTCWLGTLRPRMAKWVIQPDVCEFKAILWSQLSYQEANNFPSFSKKFLKAPFKKGIQLYDLNWFDGRPSSALALEILAVISSKDVNTTQFRIALEKKKLRGRGPLPDLRPFRRNCPKGPESGDVRFPRWVMSDEWWIDVRII